MSRTLLNDAEIELFNNIFVNNFLHIKKTGINTVQPSLLDGVVLPVLSEEDPNVKYITASIDDISSDINNASIYTPKFKEFLAKTTEIISNDNYDASLKFTLLGKLVTNFRCGNNNFNDKFKKFILTFVQVLAHNKAVSLIKLKKTLKDTVALVGNCDSGFDYISNKEFNALSLYYIKKYVVDLSKEYDVTRVPEASASSLRSAATTIKQGLSSTVHAVTKAPAAITRAPAQAYKAIYNYMWDENKDKDNADETQRRAAQAEVEAEAIKKTQQFDKDIQATLENFTTDPGKTSSKEIVTRLKHIRALSSKVRSELINLDELLKYNMVSVSELTKTIASSANSPFWIKTPALVTTSITAVNISANFYLNDSLETTTMMAKNLRNVRTWHLEGNSGTQDTLHWVFEKLSNKQSLLIASTLNTVCFPIIGLLVGLSVGTFLESDYYKNLVELRKVNLNFTPIKEKYKGKEIYKGGPLDTLSPYVECSFESDPTGYVINFLNANAKVEEYKQTSEQYFEKYLGYLYFYLFIYNYACKYEPIDVSREGNIATTGNLETTGNDNVPQVNPAEVINEDQKQNVIHKFSMQSCSDSQLPGIQFFTNLSSDEKFDILQYMTNSEYNRFDTTKRCTSGDSTEVSYFNSYISSVKDKFIIYEVNKNYENIINELESIRTRRQSNRKIHNDPFVVNLPIFLTMAPEVQKRLLIKANIFNSTIINPQLESLTSEIVDLPKNVVTNEEYNEEEYNEVPSLNEYGGNKNKTRRNRKNKTQRRLKKTKTRRNKK